MRPSRALKATPEGSRCPRCCSRLRECLRRGATRLSRVNPANWEGLNGSEGFTPPELCGTLRVFDDLWQTRSGQGSAVPVLLPRLALAPTRPFWAPATGRAALGRRFCRRMTGQAARRTSIAQRWLFRYVIVGFVAIISAGALRVRGNRPLHRQRSRCSRCRPRRRPPPREARGCRTPRHHHCIPNNREDMRPQSFRTARHFL